jgi:peptidoglycan/xylan/chitin deacetylase (PgdA/CDA1 family)
MFEVYMSRRPGVFVLSLDVEIAWGTFDHGGLQRYAAHFNQERAIVKRLVELLNKYRISATWAFVGHLLLDHCYISSGGVAHPDVLRPCYRWYPHDWHHCDPGTDVHRDPWWYAPDMLETILRAQVDHEIGTHTFSHIVVDDPDCNREIFRSQLEACIEVHRRFGLCVHSLVYPRNKVAFLDIPAELGITVYRGRAERWYADLNPYLVKVFRILDSSFAFTPKTYSLPSLANDPLVNIPASMFFLSRDGFRRAIPIRSRVQQAKRGLLRAAKRAELFHLWFHPFNLASDLRLLAGLEEILNYASRLSASGALSIATMQQAAERVRRTGQPASHE